MMVLYSGTTCPYSHRCRFVLFEKGMDFEIRDVDLFAKPEDIALMNPYNEVPILVERDLILYSRTSSTSTSTSAFRTRS
jgi:RNA polymerase-associated protein